MSSNASNTRKSSNTLANRIAAQEAATKANGEAIAEVKQGMSQLLTLVEALVTTQPTTVVEATAKRTAKPKAAKAGKAKTTTTVAKVEPTSKALTRKNLDEFRKAHPWAKGLSVFAASEAVLSGQATLAPGWRLATFRLAKAAGMSTAEFVAARGTASTVVVAKNVASEPAKVDERPRRANGTITPKGEWEIRRALQAQGLTPKQVDKRTAKAMRVLTNA